MESFLHHANIFFEKLPDRARKFRWVIWSLFLLINVVIFLGASKFKIDMTLEAYFQQGDPIKQAYDRFRAQFGGDEIMILVYEAKDGDIFSNQSLQAIKHLQDELLNYSLYLDGNEASQLDHITDVKSIVNASYMEAGSGALISRPFIGDNLPASPEQLDTWRKQALAHPDYPAQYISEDTRYGAIIVKTDFNAKQVEDIILDDLSDELDSSTEIDASDETFDSELDSEFGEIDMESSWSEQPSLLESTDDNSPKVKFQQTGIEEYSAFMAAIDPILQKNEHSEFLTFHPVGNPPIMSFFNNIILKEMGMVVMIMIVLISIALWILFRSLSAVIWSLVIVVVSFLWVVGLVGWTGVTMTFMINIIVFLILAVGVADSIHILSGYLFFRDKGEDHETALRSVFKKSGLACLLTSFTTSIGLCALIMVPVIPIRNFGIFAAIGVTVAFLLTVFILPLMLDIWAPVRKKPKASDQNKANKTNFIQQMLRRVETVGYSNPKIIITLFSIFCVTMLIGISQVKVNTNIVEIIPEDSDLRKSYNLANNKFGGSQNIEIILDAGKEDAFKDPELLNRMEALQTYVMSEYPDLVGRTMSLVNVTKDSFKALNDDAQDKYIIPQQPNVLEQTLFMFNNANLQDRRQLVSDDFSQARVTITLRNAGSYIYSPIIDDIQFQTENLFADTQNEYPNMDVRLTGGVSLMLKLMDYVSWSQIQSFGLALVIISLLLLVVFGSMRVGLIAIAPNLIPIITAFGVMGFMGMSLDTDTLLVAPIIIGIAVDDTIHFLTHYRAGLIQFGSIKESVIQSIREAGQAISFTSIVLSLGFLVFVLSSHTSLRNFGILSALSIMMALITDLFLLPALCKVFKADFSGRKTFNTTDTPNTSTSNEKGLA